MRELEDQLRGWMLATLDGDRAAYARLLERVAAMARGYAAKSMNASVRTPERIEDFAQDVLVALHRKKHLYRRDSPFLPWIFAIARYRLIDQVRSENRRPRLVVWEEWHDAVKAGRDGVEHSLEVEELLHDLPERQRRALELAKIQGLPLAEVAERLGMSLSAVKVSIHRAIRFLRRKHGMELNEEDA